MLSWSCNGKLQNYTGKIKKFTTVSDFTSKIQAKELCHENGK